MFIILFIVNTYSTSFVLFNRKSSDDVTEYDTKEDNAGVINEDEADDGTYVSVVKCLN